MFLAGERSNYNVPDFRKHGVFKCTANINSRRVSQECHKSKLLDGATFFS